MPVSVFNFFGVNANYGRIDRSLTTKWPESRLFFRVLIILYETFDTVIKRIGPLFILEVKIIANMDMNVDVKQNIIK